MTEPRIALIEQCLNLGAKINGYRSRSVRVEPGKAITIGPNLIATLTTTVDPDGIQQIADNLFEIELQLCRGDECHKSVFTPGMAMNLEPYLPLAFWPISVAMTADKTRVLWITLKFVDLDCAESPQAQA